jgi:hypothetical protein
MKSWDPIATGSQKKVEKAAILPLCYRMVADALPLAAAARGSHRWEPAFGNRP